MKARRSHPFLLATICAAWIVACGQTTTTTGVEGSNASAKQGWYTPLPPALQDELRQRALYQTELSETDETES